MKRTDLPPGIAIAGLYCIAALRSPGDLMSIAIDWAATAAAAEDGTGKSTGYNNGVGLIHIGDLSYDVYVDLETGTLWYDEDKGWQ